ncbi:MAG: MmgE/PrpD family protein [Salinarimonadaceae bacterium]|nr:MAG: MmgE/PrpD family protein [Salinarimonadaceae bacterium]
MDYLDEVARFVVETSSEEIPDAVLARSALVLADCVGAITGGMAEPEIQALIARPALAGGGPAVVIGTNRRAQPAQAALLNGTAGTVLEMDEGNQFSRGHPGMHAVPAALAFASGISVSGRELLTAIALGYEVGARVGIASRLRPSLHPHGTWGTVCAAVAVARLAGRDAAGVRHTINMAANFALANSRRTMLEGGTVRNAFAGISGQMGLTVHDLLEAGFEADRDGLGEVFGRALSETFDRAKMTEALGERWEVSRNYFKMHACCRYNHATLDALSQISEREGRIEPDSVAGVEVATYNLAVELDDPAPRNMLAARFSVPFAVATALVTGRTDVTSFTGDRLTDPAIRALGARVRVVEDAAMTAALPDNRPARITLTLKDGRRLTGETQTNRGDWADPYPEAELRAKFLSLVTRSFPENAAAALWDETLALPDRACAGGWLKSLAAG